MIRRNLRLRVDTLLDKQPFFVFAALIGSYAGLQLLIFFNPFCVSETYQSMPMKVVNFVAFGTAVARCFTDLIVLYTVIWSSSFSKSKVKVYLSSMTVTLITSLSLILALILNDGYICYDAFG